jgi:hypothetical protein
MCVRRRAAPPHTMRRSIQRVECKGDQSHDVTPVDSDPMNTSRSRRSVIRPPRHVTGLDPQRGQPAAHAHSPPLLPTRSCRRRRAAHGHGPGSIDLAQRSRPTQTRRYRRPPLSFDVECVEKIVLSAHEVHGAIHAPNAPPQPTGVARPRNVIVTMSCGPGALLICASGLKRVLA